MRTIGDGPWRAKLKSVSYQRQIESTLNAMLQHVIGWHFVASGKPMQNGFYESFNGRIRDEHLNENLFFGLEQSRTRISPTGPRTTTIQHPCSALGYQTPAAYAVNLTATCDRLCKPGLAPPIACCSTRA